MKLAKIASERSGSKPTNLMGHHGYLHVYRPKDFLSPIIGTRLTFLNLTDVTFLLLTLLCQALQLQP